MIRKKMHTMAKPIACAAGMHKFLRGGGIVCGRKAAVFAKEIIDKYTKRLNGLFDPVSLVFLEQIANDSGFAGNDAVVIVTYRLLSYLIQNTGQSGLFSNEYSFLVQQVTGQVERNLEILKDAALDAGRELESCYLEYQKMIKMEQEADAVQRRGTVHRNIVNSNVRMEQMSALQEQMRRFYQKQQIQMRKHSLDMIWERPDRQLEPEKGRDAEPLKNRMPFVMTRVFFTNLNHWVRENRLANYRQIWKQSNEQQMQRQKLKYQMQQFLQEKDFIRQEEQLSDVIRKYDREIVLQYLDQADIKLYEKLMPVLYVLSGRQKAAHSGNNSMNENRKKQRSVESGGAEDKNAGDKYSVLAAEQMLVDYREAAIQLEHLLTESDEQIQGFLQKTADEYKKYFIKYVRAVSEIQKISGPSKSVGDRSQEYEKMQAQTEEDKEVFSDAEVELLLRKEESQTASIELKAAELKLKLLAFREIAEQFLQEGSAALQQETLLKITNMLQQDLFLGRRRLDEYQKADLKLSEMISQTDDVTKNMLLEKAEEYQNLFYKYISADQIRQETESVLESLQIRQKTAEYKLNLLAYREAAQQVLQESAKRNVPKEPRQSETQQEQNIHDAVFQKENLKKMIQLMDQVSGKILQPEISQKNMKSFQLDQSDIRSILKYGSLPERKLLFFIAQKNVDELLIQLQEIKNGRQGNAAEYAAVQQRQFLGQQEDAAAAVDGNQKTESVRELVQLKNQLQKIGGQAYQHSDNWGFLMTNEADRTLFQIIQQEGHPIQNIWKQKVQQSLTDFYDHINKEEIQLKASENSMFFKEWNLVFRQEEWQQLCSLVRNQKSDYEHHTKRMNHKSDFVSKSGSGKWKSEFVSNGQSVKQELEHVWVECEKIICQAAVPGFAYLQAADFSNGIKLLQKDVLTKKVDFVQLPAQYLLFMRPPEQDVHNRQFMEDVPAQGKQAKGSAVLRTAAEQAAVIYTKQHTKDADRFQRIAEEKDQRHKQEVQRLEGDLLDYRSDLEAKAMQLEQVEKKLAAQEKELKLVRDSQHTVRIQGKTVAERRQMFHQLKEELQLERMRSGLV